MAARSPTPQHVYPAHEKESNELILKDYILTLAKYTGLFTLSRRLTSRKVRVLAYHGIWLGDGHFGNFLYMDPQTFARRMALLSQWGYPVVPLNSLTDGVEKLPDNATVITIDDGWYGTYKHMLPVLEAHGFPATIYLTTYYCLNNRPVVNVVLQYCFQNIDSEQYPSLHLPSWQFGPISLATQQDRATGLQQALEKTDGLASNEEKQMFLIAIAEAVGIDMARISTERWFHLMDQEEVGDAAQRGISFDLHTHRHRIDNDGASCLTDEINTNREHIRAMTGQDPRHFCYPSGVYRKDIWPELRDCKVLSATTTQAGLVDENSEVFALPRILDGQYISELEFEAEMSGFLEWLRKIRRSLSLSVS